MSLLTVLIVLALVGATALYVAAEFGAVSVRHNRIRQMAEDGHRLAQRLWPYLADSHELDRYIAASQIGITLSSLILGAYGQATLGAWFTPILQQWTRLEAGAAHSAAAAIVLIGLTTISVILGELVPKSLALRNPTGVALATVIPMQWSLAAYSWFIAVLNGSGVLILKLLGAPAAGHRHIHSPEEIELLIAESRDGGLLEPDEQRRLHRALQLGVRPARQLMVPRTQVVVLDILTPPEEVLRLIAESPYSRFPVFRDKMDRIVGMLHTKDVVLKYVEDGQVPPLEALIRPVLTVYETITADRLLTLMREQRVQQAVVVDESSGMAGLVTLDDVLEEVLGEVADEFKESPPEPEALPDGRVRLPGGARPDQVERWINARWDGNADTVGGLVLNKLGRLPRNGEKVRIGGVEVEVERVESQAVVSVIATPVGRRENGNG